MTDQRNRPDDDDDEDRDDDLPGAYDDTEEDPLRANERASDGPRQARRKSEVERTDSYEDQATVPEAHPLERLDPKERAMLRSDSRPPASAADEDEDVEVEHDDEEGSEGEPIERRPALILAEFDTPAGVLHAAEKVRDAGYEKWDVHTPFPVHGMDRAMGLGDSPLGWIVLVMGLTGCAGAALMMWWMNGFDYPLIIGGKPPDAIPSMIPIMFECTILLSGIGAVFGMFGLNQLPRHHHPVFYSTRFERCSDDKFFISVEAQDPKFDLKRTKQLFETAHATHIELIEEEVP